jgi:DnaJ-class molecular chaperone
VTYADLQSAVAIMGLRERSTIREIKARHRELVKRYHPDAGNSHDPEMIRKVNAAYRILLDYVAEYHFSFAEAEFYEQNPEEKIRMQFMDSPFWGKG